jgi:hypothetical protein
VERKDIVIVRRRTWLYRLSGQRHVHSISFKSPMTAAQVKEALRQSVGVPQELWGRSNTDPGGTHEA